MTTARARSPTLLLELHEERRRQHDAAVQLPAQIWVSDCP
jgi:hypothetical protein